MKYTDDAARWLPSRPLDNPSPLMHTMKSLIGPDAIVNVDDLRRAFAAFWLQQQWLDYTHALKTNNAVLIAELARTPGVYHACLFGVLDPGDLDLCDWILFMDSLYEDEETRWWQTSRMDSQRDEGYDPFDYFGNDGDLV